MRYLNAKLILMSVALMLSATASFALPTCSGSPTKNWWKTKNWDNCIGSYIFTGLGFADGHTFVGEYHDGERYGYGTWTFKNHVRKGFFIGNSIRPDPSIKTLIKKAPAASLLKSLFVKSSKAQRKQTQSILKSLGFYKSKIDGLFGKGTSSALVAYNKKYLEGADLSKSDNVSKLMAAVLALNSSPIPKPKVIQTDILPACPSSGYFHNCFGTYTFANGNKYVGEYKDNKKNGQGTLTYADGTIEEGIWKDGELQYAQAIPEVVETDDTSETLEVASGTGFYVSNEGHIITNHHVIDGCMDMKVHTKGRILPTLRIADDKQNDLALLKISETPSYVFALSNSSPYPLQEIIVAGFPFGDRYSSTLKFTKGIVSSLAGMGDNYSEIQIDAALQQGNSGGPIIDEYGNVVAVAVAKLDAKYMFDNFGIIPENTNFGIKASAVRNLLEGNQVPLKIPATDVISKRDLSRLATDGTVYLTCWMTNAQLEQMKSKKVMFENFN